MAQPGHSAAVAPLAGLKLDPSIGHSPRPPTGGRTDM
jgi:hypothetical protein